MTLEQLGEVVGRPAPFLSMVENGKREPKLSQIAALAAAVGVTPADLLDPEPPNRRARLEIALEKAQSTPRYQALRLPYLKPSTRVPDEVLEHVVTLFEELERPDERGAPGEVREAAAAVWERLRRADGYLEHVEEAARQALAKTDYGGSGPLTARTLMDLAAAFGFRVQSVEDMPGGVRSVADLRNRRIYVAQRNELRTRQARKAILQALAMFALGHDQPASVEEFLTQRVETAYFAAAVLIPEAPAVAFLQTARADRDLSVEDLKEAFYTSYEMAAQRFCNLATRHLGLRTHFIRSDPAGRVWKSYANDGIPFPSGGGAPEGWRLCREWAARVAYRSQGKFDLHHQYTDTPAGTFWCSTHIATDQSNHALTVGAAFDEARYFRGRDTEHHRVSRCPEGPCCRRPTPELAARWEGRVVASGRAQERILGLLAPDPFPDVDPLEVVEMVERHAEG